ncbi:carboxymuconolactone decarboxylase family protein [Micromonospora polyrhachis]|uniref:AhpD family alkylhydroperoxidase n=1 Tax=Micromonospora polyrhachis TaxID=1282883 RepID=A0A7W7WR59_9ACTN|nr:carboxymuconolactone decarboxylase family protein [Micromonospora polyrhachis]MBB4959988.1 AhpD family alkylhydroperoxidase [Micromonospora polyrhachis]
MTRIALVADKQASWLTRLAFRVARRMYGEVPEPFRAAAHHPALMWTSAVHEMTYGKAVGRLDAALRDLVVHRVATRVGCSWCVDFGTMLTLKAGFSVERHRELSRYQTSDAFTELEKLALRFADAMTDLPMDVTDELVTALREHLDEAQLVELTYAISLENMRARTNHALGLTAQGYTSGDACPVPWATQISEAAPQS